VNRKRRMGRHGFLVALFLAVFALVVYAGIDALSFFQLDGNATTNGGGGDDWQTMPSSNANFLTWTGILADSGSGGAGPNVNDGTTFTTGGSKDVNPIGSWRYTAGSLPDKDDITNAYAAAYTNPANNHLIVYFGADRFANNGSAQLGFWFTQSRIGLNGDGTFSGTHTPNGDFLVLANFTSGGTTAEIDVLKWVGTGGDQKGGTLQSLSSGTLTCGSAGSSDACAISNANPVQLYWAYTPKFPVTGTFPTGSYEGFCATATNCAPVASFFEGGIDVTELLGSTPCISSFLAETRSSSGSVTAQLEDFVLGSFNVCGFNVNKICGGGTADGSNVKYTFGGVAHNTGLSTLTGVTITDTFPSDASSITPAGTTGSSSYIRSYNIGDIAAGACKTWPDGNTVDCSTDLSSIDFSGNTFDTGTSGAENDVTGATANSGTITGTKPGGGDLPFATTCPAAAAPTLTAAKSCSVSISSSLAVTVGFTGSVCNTSGFTITNLSATDVQTDGTYGTLSGAAGAASITLYNNSDNATTTLQACTESAGDCNTTNQANYPNTCATFDDSYAPSEASSSSADCPANVKFYDKVHVTGKYLGTGNISKDAMTNCPLCGGTCSTLPSFTPASSTTIKTRGNRRRP
jgi:hypothetical protein